MRPEERRAWTELAERTRKPQARGLASLLELGGSKPAKYRNEKTEVDGIRFDSKLEADRWRELMMLKRAGEVKFVLRQVPFDVAPGVVYRLDFLILWSPLGTMPERLSYEDTKGILTAASRVKIAAVEERYGIKVRLVRRGDVSR